MYARERASARVRENRVRERGRRRAREIAVTILRVAGYAAAIAAGFYACGLMVYMVAS